MKILIEDYTFNKASKQVTLTGFTSVTLSRFLIITNVTANEIIYLFNNPSLGGTVSGNVLTLVYNTSAMADTDKLQIYIDDASQAATEDSQQLLSDLIISLNELVSRLAPLAGVVANTATIRTSILSSNTLSVSGPITSANSIAEKVAGGVMYPTMVAEQNSNAVISNVNNVIP